MALDLTGKSAAESLVPHVIGETGDRGHLLLQETGEGGGILEQARVDPVAKVRLGVGRYVSDREWSVVGVYGDAGMRQIGERNYGRHSVKASFRDS